MNGFAREDEADDLEEAVLSGVDPLEAERRKSDAMGSIDIAAYVADLFKSLAAARPELLQAGAAELTPMQAAAVQRIWGS